MIVEPDKRLFAKILVDAFETRLWFDRRDLDAELGASIIVFVS